LTGEIAVLVLDEGDGDGIIAANFKEDLK